METEITAMQPKAKNVQQKLGDSGNGISPNTCRGSTALPALRLCTSGLHR